MEQIQYAADRRQLPIGVFDSGLGGISVLRELVRILPQEDFYYIGDDVNAPYGTKSVEQIRELTLQHVEHMRREGIKALVVACNTATSAAIGMLRERYTDMPVIGIEPALKPAVRMPVAVTDEQHRVVSGLPDEDRDKTVVSSEPSRRVIVMATPGTVHGKKYLELMQRYEDEAQILPLGCPGLMEYVERGELHSDSLRRYLEELLLPNQAKQADAIVLGCTHYPFVRSAIREVVGAGPMILDGSEGTARETYRRLAAEDLLRSEEHAGKVTFHMTLPEKEPLAHRLLELQQL